MILPVSAQRFCCRNRVKRVGAHWGAKSAREKYKGSDGTANFGLLRDRSFLAARMGAVTYRFVFCIDLMKIKTSLQKRVYAFSSHTRPQKGGVHEEAKIGRTITGFVFFTCALGAPMTDYLRYAVSAAEPLCTHGKDHPGLGPPNSLKPNMTNFRRGRALSLIHI